MRKVSYGFVFVIALITFISCEKDKEDNQTPVQEVIIDDGVVAHFDWRDEGVMTVAKNQGPYGSCGVFAAMGVFEALIARESNQLVDLSEQHYINASDTWNPNTGVNPSSVFEFMIANGIVLESRLPYQASITTELPDGDVDYLMNSYQSVGLESLSIDQSRKLIKETILEHGPVAAAMDYISALNNYSGGIFNPQNTQASGGHWVVICGWQDDPTVPNGGYWIIKNSEGPNWGEDGYLKSPYTLCNVDRYVFNYANYEVN